MSRAGGSPSQGGKHLPEVRSQVLSLKVVDLNKILGVLGLARGGRKADLQNRLLTYIGEMAMPTERPKPLDWQVEHAVEVIRDVFLCSKGETNRKGTGQGYSDAAGVHTSKLANMMKRSLPTKIKLITPRGNDPPTKILRTGEDKELDMNMRCICQGSKARGRMVQCQDPTCRVWQHSDCVYGTSKEPPAGGKEHYCELCRAHLSDPFWLPIETILPPAKMKHVIGQPPMKDQYGTLLPHQSLERAVFLSVEQLQEAHEDKAKVRVQMSCILLGDEVSLRNHWPRHVNLRVNSMSYRPYGRSLSAKMGINQRDNAANISSLCLRGRNSIEMQAADQGTWLVLVQRSKRRSWKEVKALMAPDETLNESKQRIRRLLGAVGKGSEEHEKTSAADDVDEEISISCQLLYLNDPMSGQRIKCPARFVDASGLQPFDLDSFFSIVERNRKWQDPTTLRNSNIRKLQCDAFTQRILDCLSCAPHVSVVEVNRQGCWRLDGSQEEWYDVDTPTAEIQQKIRLEREKKGKAINPSLHGNDGEVALLDGGSDDSEVDEEAEFLEAVRALGRKNKTVTVAPSRVSEKEPEVIELLDSDDDVPTSNPRNPSESFQPAARLGNMKRMFL